jgi:uncharacterized protein (DUF433 family)
MEFIHPDFPRISANPEISFGKPCIKGTRIAVSSILSYLATGMSIDEFLIDFPFLTKEDIQEAIAFAAAMLQEKYIPLQKAS